MERPDNNVFAYRESGEAMAREYPFRMGVSVIVAIVVGVVAGVPAAFAWWLAMGAFLGAEVIAYRRYFSIERTHIPVSMRAGFSAVSMIAATAYSAPAWILVADGSPWAIYAAVAMMAGTLIHLTVHNAASHLIYAASVSPMALSFIASGAILSFEARSPIPLVAAMAFVGALVAAYLARTDYIRRLQEATSLARAQQEAAEEASVAKSRFLAKMSHELRTPLNGIIGMAEVLRESDMNFDQREKLDIVLKSSDTLLWLLNDILDHAKIEADHLELEIADEDLRDIVAQSTTLFRPGAIRKQVSLTYDMGGVEIPYLKLDGRRLRQCVNNLLSNAVKFTDEGAIQVRATATAMTPAPPANERADRVAAALARIEAKLKGGPPADDAEALAGVAAAARDSAGKDAAEEGGGDDAPGRAKVVIEVADSGIGMSAEQSLRVFDAFEQADNSITRRFGGTGLGLSVSRAVVRAMGGDITVASKPGAGSTFRIEFEAEIGEAPAEDDLGVVSEELVRSGGSVLLVEDNLVNRKVVCALLAKHKMTIVEAENGAVALENLAERRFDMVLMDIHMPVMDGLTATRKIRGSSEAWSRTPIVALTAAVAQEDRAACLEAGVDGMLAKPVRAGELIEMLDRFVWGAMEEIIDAAALRDVAFEDEASEAQAADPLAEAFARRKGLG